MQQPILIMLFSLASVLTMAQEAETTIPAKRTHQLGVNVTSFLGQFLNLGGNSLASSPYQITYRVNSPGNPWGFRTGLGANFLRNSNDILGFSDDEVFNNLGLDLRIGFDYVKPLSERWNSYFGADVVFAASKSETIVNNGFDKVTTNRQSTRGGLGPIAGIQFYINKYLCLGTESTYYFTYTLTNSKQRFESFPENNDNRTSKSYGFNFSLPSTLYLIYCF